MLCGDPLIRLSPPIDHAAIVRLLVRAALVVTDSGGLQEEAATLGIPVVVLRTRTERMEAVEDGRAMLAGSDPEAILSAARSEEHTSELQSLMRISYAVFCLKKKTNQR